MIFWFQQIEYYLFHLERDDTKIQILNILPAQ